MAEQKPDQVRAGAKLAKDGAVNNWASAAIAVGLSMVLLGIFQRYNNHRAAKGLPRLKLDTSVLLIASIYGVLAFGALGIGTLVYERFWGAPPQEKHVNSRTGAAAANPPSNSAPAAAAPAAIPPKFYSPRNKSELADALTDLKTILNTTADAIVQRKWQLDQIWDKRYEPSKATPSYMTELLEKIDEVSALTVTLSRAIYDADGGLLRKYHTYPDELRELLEWPPNAATAGPMTALQVGLNRFRDGIAALRRARELKDDQLVHSIMQSMGPAQEKLTDGDHAFRVWLEGTRKRISDFQITLDKAGH
jgi:hypothetical protein